MGGGQTTSVVRMETREQVIHINRICPFLQEDTTARESQTWTPPLFFHCDSDDNVKKIAKNDPIITDDSHVVRTTRSGRETRPVDYYGY